MTVPLQQTGEKENGEGTSTNGSRKERRTWRWRGERGVVEQRPFFPLCFSISLFSDLPECVCVCVF